MLTVVIASITRDAAAREDGRALSIIRMTMRFVST